MLKTQSYFKYFILVGLFLLFLTKITAAPVITKNTKILASFDSTMTLDYAQDTTISVLSGTPSIVADGKTGSCLRLGASDSISISGSNVGTVSEGTMMFWVRPHWSNNQGVSHTFFGMNLNDGNDGYMVFTDGWWETAGGLDRMYFISNNQFGLSANKDDDDMVLEAEKWYHMAVSFRFDGSSNSFTRIYIDGKLVNNDVTPGYNTPVAVSPLNIIKIGASDGINGTLPRYANSDFDDLVFLDKALSDNEVTAEYNWTNQREIALHFDTSIAQLELDEAVSDSTVTVVGDPQILDDGIIGKCISLDQDDYITFNGVDNIGEFKESTVMFWVRPHWTNNQNISHAFFSMNLNDGNGGYMAISDGWWESSGGINRLYAIPNNQFGSVLNETDVNAPFINGNWYHIVMTSRFDGSDNTFKKLYINGELIKSSINYGYNTPTVVSPSGVMQLGTSYGVNGLDYRYADADFDEFYFYNYIVLSDEVKTIYNNQKDGDLKIVASFKSAVKVDSAADTSNLTSIGTPSITYSDIGGYCLTLNDGDSLEFEAADNIGEFSEGTVMFWVRPHWDNNQGVSHSFFAMNLDDGNSGYMLITDGWWEGSGGTNILYAIADNQFGLTLNKTDSSLPLLAGEWHQIAMSFSFDGLNNSFNELYIDGKLVTQRITTSYNTPAAVSAKDVLKIGNTLGINRSTDSRWADADYADFNFFSKSLTAEGIAANYSLVSPLKFQYRDIYTIADDIYSPERNASGVIRESRILLDEEGSYSTKADAEKLVDDAVSAGFNIIMPAVFHGYGTRYHTDYKYNNTSVPIVAKYNVYIDGKDPLEYLIDYAHSKGIEVHAWFCVNYVGTPMVSLYDANNWIDDNYMQTNKHIVNVHRPEFGDYYSDMVLDLATNYDVDGINLDYIRAKGFFADAYSISDYSTIYTRSLTDDITNEQYDYLGDWNYNAITSIVTKINTKIKNYDSDMPISICGHFKLDSETDTLDYAIAGRDGKRWVDASIIDFSLSMDYDLSPDYNRFKEWLGEFSSDPTGKAGSIAGNYDIEDGNVVSRDAVHTGALVRLSQQMKTGVVGLYYYGTLNDEQISSISGDAFSEQAVPFYE
jgi:Glycosyl hydrolase-like 10/Concanavalin A-like lectin/glucanases superfamily